jgi:hypothetical protein
MVVNVQAMESSNPLTVRHVKRRKWGVRKGVQEKVGGGYGGGNDSSYGGGGGVDWLLLSQKLLGAEFHQEEAAHVHLAVPLRPCPVVMNCKTFRVL